MSNVSPTVLDKLPMALPDVYLPKWPQMLVWGTPVTLLQAKEIIFRTDAFLTRLDCFSGGNNKRWMSWARQELGLLPLVGFNKNEPEHEQMCKRFRLKPEQLSDFGHEMQNRVNTALGVIDTDYVTNRWASCAYILGPHGWCHPNGLIQYSDNIGSWPDLACVVREWGTIADAFPFLELTATLMSGEYSEEDAKPLVSLRVENGRVSVLPTPTLPDWAQGPRMPATNDQLIAALAKSSPVMGNSEQGLPDDWIRQAGKKLKPLIATLAEQLAADIREKKSTPFLPPKVELLQFLEG